MTTDSETISWTDMLIADFRAHDGHVTGGPMSGAPLLLLTTVGAKSGQLRTTPLMYTRDGERYVVVGSNRGEPTHPAWLTNVRANPEVTVEAGMETFRARAVVTTEPERSRLFDAHAAVLPNFADYVTMTERQLQVITLERLAAD